MNLFVVGWSPAGAADEGRARWAVRELGARLPFLDAGRVDGWRAPSGRVAAAWLSHPAEQTGGVSYVHAGAERLALFAGRPILWTPGGGADGRLPLRPATFVAPSADWAEGLDGRCAVVRCDDAAGELEVWTDPLGAYPVFRAQAEGTTWISNSAALLRELEGGRRLDPAALAGLLGGGWPLDGHPVWGGVRRLPRGAVLRMRADARPQERQQLELEEIVGMLGRGMDDSEAAGMVVEGLRALADWPGRPSLVPVTGGRDSRLVLGAAMAANIPFQAATGGAPSDPDVVAAREVCSAAGVGHSLLPADPHGDFVGDPVRAASLLALTAGGTASLADAAGFPMGPRDGPLALWHSGQGGEIARSYYGRGPANVDELVDLLYRRFTGRRPGRSEPLSPQGRELVERQLRGWVERQLGAGADTVDVPDLFYLLKRMGTWAGPTHGAVEWVRDTTSPLWSRRLLPHQLGLSAGERAREHFHLRVLRRLAPELVAVSFADGFSWASRPSRLARARQLAGKAMAEARRRARVTRPAAGREPPADPFGRVQRLVLDAAAERAQHPAWEVLDRRRVEELLTREPAGLDTMSRYYVWRLATVLLADEFA